MDSPRKYEEICAPQVEEFCYITDNTYTREEVGHNPFSQEYLLSSLCCKEYKLYGWSKVKVIITMQLNWSVCDVRFWRWRGLSWTICILSLLARQPRVFFGMFCQLKSVFKFNGYDHKIWQLFPKLCWYVGVLFEQPKLDKRYKYWMHFFVINAFATIFLI